MPNPLAGEPLHKEGAYRLQPRPLGRGGQAEVFLAEHRATGVEVALKRLRSSNVEAVRRMGREIDFCRLGLRNEHIMPVYDYGLRHNWFVMPRAEANAAERRSSLLADDELAALVFAVCSALEAAHERGWLHRDLKPENVLLLDGRWTVADWGLGRRPRGETTFSGLTTAGNPLGTEGFAAPEQTVDAHEVTATADLYSLGQLIGWARTGRTPRKGSQLLPDDEPWRSIVEAATRKDPLARPQSAREFAEILKSELARG